MEHFKSLSIYAFAVFFNAVLSFLAFSIITHHLNEVDLGIINLYNSFIGFLSPFIAIGVQYAIGIDYFTLEEKPFRQHFTNSMVIPVIACILFTILFACFSGFIQGFTSMPFFFTVTIPLACLLTILNDIFLNLFRNKEKFFLFAGFSIFKNSLEITFTVFLIVYVGHHWEGRLESFLLSLVIVLLLILYFIRRWHLFTGRFEWRDTLKVFKKGLPFVPERFGIFILIYSDRFFINYFEGTDDVGFYGAGGQVAIIVYLVSHALNNTFHPQIFKALSQTPRDHKKLRNATLTYISLSVLVTAGVVVSIPLIFEYFIGPLFQRGQIYALYLTIAMFLWAIYNAFLPFLLSFGKNKMIMMISIAGMVISLVGNYFNVKHLGALGAAYTSILVYFFMAAVTIFFVHKHYGLGKIFKPGSSVNIENN